MRKLKKITALLAITLLSSASLNAQAIKQADLAQTWKTVTNMFVATANSMPAEYYSWKPTEELASFGALVNHTAGANYLYGPTVDGPKVSGSDIDTNSKEDVINKLEVSFKYVKDAIAKLKDSNMEEEIDWFGSKMPRIKAIMGLMDHVQREYGKVITYARLKGVEPQRGSGW